VDRELVIVEANRAYCAIVGRRREDPRRPMFEAFPTDPADPTGDGVANLRASMERARDTGRPDTMAVQRYDVEDAATASSPSATGAR
jgi:PAS domain-containing protein